MKYDKTTIFGVGLCVVILVLWGPVTRRMMPPSSLPAPVDTPHIQDGKAAAPRTGETAAPSRPQVVQESVPGPAPAAPVPVGALPVGLLRDPAQPRIEPTGPAKVLTVPGQFSVSIDPAGGGVTQVALETYLTSKNKNGEQAPVELGLPQFPFCSVDPALLHATAEIPTVISEAWDHLRTSRNILGGDVRLIEEWRTDPEKPYELWYGISVVNESDVPVLLGNFAVDAGALPPSVATGKASQRMGMGAGGVTVAFTPDGRPKTFSAKDAAKFQRLPEKAQFLKESNVEWLAVHSKYFLFYIASAEGRPFNGCAVESIAFTPEGEVKTPGKNDRSWFRGEVFVDGGSLKPGETKQWDLRCYAGPKQYHLLKDIGGNLDAVMDMDRFLFFHPRWMGFLSQQILKSLIWLNRVFDCEWGYGYAILILTIVVKLLFWPLTHKSTQSMRKMQKLQPELKALREKCKDDPQKLYRKQMELYKQNNVSQFGGCLPIVFQIPVFFALFNTFRSAIELRQASFLWAVDLSLPDTLGFSPEGLPIRPLAILMGASMIGQQKLMPTGDPSQARMMMFMSAFFIFLFYSMPSALTLYWSMSQILTIAQALITRRLEKKQEV